VTGLRFGTLLCLGVLVLPAQQLRDAERKVTEFTLSNGMHFILLERHQVPVVSFHTLVNAGFAQDPAGQSGLAHLLERLAFKGTENIGTRNWAAEKKALEDVEDVYDRMMAERNKGVRASQIQLAALELDADRAAGMAQSQEDPGEFERVFQENGGVGLSCRTTPDSIETSYSLPSNRIELWFLMESQRLAHPVFREFYQERSAILTEIQNSVDTKPLPKLRQALLATAFAAHPYRNPPLGWPSDVANLRRADAKAFVDTYWVPGNIVMGIVGDVDPASAQRLAERYFGTIPAKPLPAVIHTQEPPQLGPKTVALLGSGQPLLMVGYKRPSQTHADDLALDVVRMILGEGQAGWMYKELVEEKRIAQAVEADDTFPAGRYTSLFVFTVSPARDRTVEENQKALDELLARFIAKPVDADTLARVKNMLRGRIARLLGSNQELAALLPAYYAGYGDWRKLFNVLSGYDHLTAEDLQRVAARYFTPANRTAAYLSDAVQPVLPPSGKGGPQ
jgi:predicted Zn-dependent peptidase